MRVVIDTNVVVSAALRDRGPERVILAVVERPEFEWLASAAILQEYREVLSRPKFALPGALLERWLRVLDVSPTFVDIPLNIDFPRDRADAKFLECALACGADFLITGDKDFEEARRVVKTTIISVAQFEKLVLAQLT